MVICSSNINKISIPISCGAPDFGNSRYTRCVFCSTFEHWSSFLTIDFGFHQSRTSEFSIFICLVMTQKRRGKMECKNPQRDGVLRRLIDEQIILFVRFWILKFRLTIYILWGERQRVIFLKVLYVTVLIPSFHMSI